MSKPLFVVQVADLERGPKSATWSIPEAWLRDTLEGTDATPTGGDGELDVELSKNGREVMVRGRAVVKVSMPCVVTLDPLPFSLSPEIFLLLAPATPTAQGKKGRRAPAVPGREKPPSPERTAKSRAAARRAARDEEPELSPETAARDTFEGEKVVLDDFVREFILLELPMYPRRSDLPPDETPAIAPPSPAAASQPAVDPRFAPLAAIASRLRQQKKE